MRGRGPLQKFFDRVLRYRGATETTLSATLPFWMTNMSDTYTYIRIVPLLTLFT